MNIEDPKIIEEDKDFRVEFWIIGWRFHSAKMPILQARILYKQITGSDYPDEM